VRRLFLVPFVAACGGDLATPPDAAPDATPAVDAAPEADDPSCNCVPPPPDGFFYVGYAEGATLPDCPAGFLDGSDFVMAHGDPATCACSCNGVKAAGCVADDVKISYGTSCNALTSTLAGFGTTSCWTTSVSTSPGSTVYASMSVTKFSAYGDCNAPTFTSDIPPLVEQPVRTCQPRQPYAGCTNGRSCLPKDTTGFAMCVQGFDASAPCPPDFPERHDIGDSVVDTRHCSLCVCQVEGGTCAVVSAPAYTGQVCGGTPVATLDSTCASVGASTLAFQSFFTNTRLDGSVCAGSASTPVGSVAYAGHVAVCCGP
jgi:hypothetical protein